jgi:hypothetical protein
MSPSVTDVNTLNEKWHRLRHFHIYYSRRIVKRATKLEQTTRQTEQLCISVGCSKLLLRNKERKGRKTAKKYRGMGRGRKNIKKRTHNKKKMKKNRNGVQNRWNVGSNKCLPILIFLHKRKIIVRVFVCYFSCFSLFRLHFKKIWLSLVPLFTFTITCGSISQLNKIHHFIKIRCILLYQLGKIVCFWNQFQMK